MPNIPWIELDHETTWYEDTLAEFLNPDSVTADLSPNLRGSVLVEYELLTSSSAKNP